VTTREAATATEADPTCSILMPAYNAARTIGAAIESVLAQTLSDFELIVVDDGSGDDTAACVETFRSDRRVRLIRQPNRGQATARNNALAAASGVYVSLLDSDDLWLPRYLEIMCGSLDTNRSAAVAYTDAWVLDDATRRIGRTTITAPWRPSSSPRESEQFLRALLELGNFVFVGATIRRTVLNDVGVFRAGLEPSEDYELWLRIAAHGYRFLRIDSPLAIYRRSPTQMSANQAVLDRAAEEVFRLVADEYDVPDDVRELARRRLPMKRFPRRQQRHLPRLARRPYNALSGLKHFYVRPPKQVREAFPDLRVL
jgi:glycosyltransferase involved in cell wall biosynthesis